MRTVGLHDDRTADFSSLLLMIANFSGKISAENIRNAKLQGKDAFRFVTRGATLPKHQLIYLW